MAIEHQEPSEPKSDGAVRAGCIIFGVLALLLTIPLWGYIAFFFFYSCGPKSFG